MMGNAVMTRVQNVMMNREPCVVSTDALSYEWGEEQLDSELERRG